MRAGRERGGVVGHCLQGVPSCRIISCQFIFMHAHTICDDLQPLEDCAHRIATRENAWARRNAQITDFLRFVRVPPLKSARENLFRSDWAETHWAYAKWCRTTCVQVTAPADAQFAWEDNIL